MPSSYTTGARFTLQATGENNNTWGAILNSGVFQLVDDNINGRLGFALSGAKALTTANGATDEARMKFLDVTGGSGGTVTIPAVSKGYYVRNAGSGNVVISAGGATTATLKPGDMQPVFSDGASVYNLRIAGQTLQDFITGQITGSGNLPPATAGALGQVLMVQAGPAWGPGLVGAAQMAPGTSIANLGYTPANKAGDTFTGAITAPALYASSGRMTMVADAAYAYLYMDGQASPQSFFQYNIANKTLVWATGGAPKITVAANGDTVFAGAIQASNVYVGGGSRFYLTTDVATVSNIALNGSTCYLSYTWASGVLNYVVNNVSVFNIDAGGNVTFSGGLFGNVTPTNNTVSTAKLQDGAVTSPKIAGGAVNNGHIVDNAITSGKIGNQQVGSQHLYPGSAVANIGYTPLNRAGDVCTGQLTVNGQLYGVGGVFAGSGGRIAMGTDNATYSRLYLDQANGNYIHCNWNTGKITFYHGNVATMSVTPQGVITAYNFVIGNP